MRASHSTHTIQLVYQLICGETYTHLHILYWSTSSFVEKPILIYTYYSIGPPAHLWGNPYSSTHTILVHQLICGETHTHLHILYWSTSSFVGKPIPIYTYYSIGLPAHLWGNPYSSTHTIQLAQLQVHVSYSAVGHVTRTSVAMVSALSFKAFSCSSCSANLPYWSKASVEALCAWVCVCVFGCMCMYVCESASE